MRITFVIALLAFSGCTTSEDSPVSETTPRESLDAVVEIDPESGAKRFQGVWLVPDAGPRLLIAYRNDPLWAGFVGKRVSVVIERYTPDAKEQAIQAPHARVVTLEADPELQTPFVEVGAPKTLRGHFANKSGEAGSKSEGSRWTVFVSSEGEHLVLNAEDAELEVELEIEARSVVQSPFSAHLGSPVLWVVH